MIKLKIEHIRSILLLACFLLTALNLSAQQLTGKVTDAGTGEPLPFANVFYTSKNSTQTGINGEFKIGFLNHKLTISMVGYKTQTIRPKAAGNIEVKLQPVDYTEFGEALVTVKKKKYSRKDNPAVELMKKVVAAKRRSELKKHAYYTFEKYSKTTFGFNDVSESTFDQGFLKNYSILKDQIETCNETGKRILPISVDEIVTQEIYRRSPKTEKSIIKGKRTSGFNNLFYTGDILNTAIQDCFTDINLYDDEVRLLQYPFNSPIAASSLSFYRYFIVDTLMLGNEKCIEVNFTPNNSQDFGFSGSLYIAADSTYRMIRADIGIPHRSDVNYVEQMRIIQDFSLLPSGEQVLTSNNMVVQLKVADFLQKFHVKRVTEYSHFSFEEIPDKSFKIKGPEMTLADATHKNEAFWETYRPEPLSKSESGLDNAIKNLQNIKGFKPFLLVAKAFIENFIETSTDPNKPSKIDIGPVNTTITHNFVEGLRLRASAQSTSALHPHLFFRTYLAYGLKDHRVKGLGELTYSFLPKESLPREFPVHNLTFSYNNDVMSPSDKFLTTDKDNVFTALKWTKVDHMMYFESLKLLYDKEWMNNIRLKLQLRREKDEPTAALFFQPLSGSITPTEDKSLWKNHIVTTDATLTLEYQPGAVWVNTKQRRRKVNYDNFVFSLSHSMGLNGFLGGQYTYHITETSIYKRFWMSSWGKIDLQFKGGAQWTKVPFPLLLMPAANLSYIMQDNTFSLINNMEFLNDRYASLMMSWDFNGKIFNRVPLLKRLKWREYLGCNILWGELTDKNNPFLDENLNDTRLFYFPGHFKANGTYEYLSRPMKNHKPYIEVFAGIHNIFKIIHIQYVRRLTYTAGIPNRHKWGIRGQLVFTF